MARRELLGALARGGAQALGRRQAFRLLDVHCRMLITQAMLDGLHLVSIEHAFNAYGVHRLW